MPDEMKNNTRLPSPVYRVPEFIELKSPLGSNSINSRNSTN